MFLFVSGDEIHILKYFIFGPGFVSSAIHTTVIMLGSLQTRISSPKLVNFILTYGTVGTMLTFVVTGPIVAHLDVHAALFGALLLVAGAYLVAKRSF
ncbi:putative transporter [Serratia marcescens]|nr:putative transporter [Serratia marcescens]